MLEDYAPCVIKTLETTFTVGSLNHTKNQTLASFPACLAAEFQSKYN